MKKCPFCKADIEDHARFCLYCMEPLNEKEVVPPLQRKKRWWLLVVGIVVIALAFFIPKNIDILQKEVAGTPKTGKTNATDSIGQQEKTPVSDGVSTIENQTRPLETTIPEQAQYTTTSPQTREPESTQPESGYTYRLAQAGDEFSANYRNTGNDIVITGVPKSVADGVYVIPDYIDGKQVITIDANAFYGSNVRTVYLPKTVRYIKTYAFVGCQITDIYFTQNLYISDFPELENGKIVVLHCPRDCQDRNRQYYSSFAECPELYGATWEEWDG